VPSPRRVVEGSHPDPRLSGFGSPRSQRLGQQAGSRPYTGVLGLAARTLPLVEVDPPSARRQPAWDHNTWSCAKPLVRRMAAGSLGFSPAVCWEESDTTDHLGNSSNSLAGRVGAPTPRQRPPDKRLRPTNDSRRPDERVLIDAAVTYIKQLQQLNRTREDVAAVEANTPRKVSSKYKDVSARVMTPRQIDYSATAPARPSSARPPLVPRNFVAGRPAWQANQASAAGWEQSAPLSTLGPQAKEQLLQLRSKPKPPVVWRTSLGAPTLSMGHMCGGTCFVF